MNRKNIQAWPFIAIATGFLFACGSGQKPREAPAQIVSDVSVEMVHLQTIPEYYEAVGAIRSAASSVLGAQISGTIREIRVKPADRVKRGQLLAILDDHSPRAQLAAGAISAGIRADGFQLLSDRLLDRRPCDGEGR